MVNGFDFARAVMLYYRAYNSSDDRTKSNVVKWFRGSTRQKPSEKRLERQLYRKRRQLYDFLKVFAVFLVRAGYKGLLIIIDELVNIFKISHTATRQGNYEKILTMYNDALQGKAGYIGFLLGGTPQCVEDKYRGLFSYEALRSRLSAGRYASEEYRDMLAPIIRLSMLTHEEMYVLIEKLAAIHGRLFDYAPRIARKELLAFLTEEYSRVGASAHMTPREIIRDFIELLDILYQNPEQEAASILGSGDYIIRENAGTSFRNLSFERSRLHYERVRASGALYTGLYLREQMDGAEGHPGGGLRGRLRQRRQSAAFLRDGFGKDRSGLSARVDRAVLQALVLGRGAVHKPAEGADKRPVQAPRPSAARIGPAGLQVARDASASDKNRLVKNPKGVLQITPESLESLLTRKRGACLGLFGDLRFVIIDEVHQFMRDARGVQVLCLLERLQRLTGNVPRRIGLSATLGDLEAAKTG
jgi:hypothetical protein